MKQFDLVMFDLDGTLVQTAPEFLEAVNDTLRRFVLPEVTLTQVSDWIGNGMRELLIRAIADACQAAPDAVRQSELLRLMEPVFNVYFLQRCGTCSQLYPHVRETLTALRDRQVKLALVTNKESRYTQLVLAAHQLTDLFDAVVCGDTLPVKKPHPDGVERCLAQFGIAKNRALLVGDSCIDVATARRAGVAVWALPYGYNQGQPIEISAPDRVISDCSALYCL